jgi:hypothetical protein
MPPDPNKKRNPWTKLPTWAKWTVGIVGALILLGIGGAIGSSNESDLKSEVSHLESKVALVSKERAKAEGEAARVQGLESKIVGEAKERAESIVGSAKAESEESKESLGSLKGEVSSAKQELASVEGSLEGAEHTKELSSFGDGIWKAETDYVPGTYRAPGGSGCYWATLKSANPYDIESNENGTGPQIAEIHTPYFQTKGCGTWTRIGE